MASVRRDAPGQDDDGSWSCIRRDRREETADAADREAEVVGVLRRYQPAWDDGGAEKGVGHLLLVRTVRTRPPAGQVAQDHLDHFGGGAPQGIGLTSAPRGHGDPAPDAPQLSLDVARGRPGPRAATVSWLEDYPLSFRASGSGGHVHGHRLRGARSLPRCIGDVMIVGPSMSFQAASRPRSAVDVGSVVAAVLILLVLASACTPQQESPVAQTGRSGVPPSLLGAGPDGRAHLSSGRMTLLLPPHLAGYPAVTLRPVPRAGSVDESAAPGNGGCPEQVRGLLRAIAEGQSFASPATTRPMVAARAYGAARQPVLWAMAFTSRSSSTGELLSFFRGAPSGPRCLRLDYIFNAGGIRVSGALPPIPAFDQVRFLRARLDGNNLMVACASHVEESACRGAMIQLVHWLGL